MIICSGSEMSSESGIDKNVVVASIERNGGALALCCSDLRRTCEPSVL